jgi:hypothetical protein
VPDCAAILVGSNSAAASTDAMAALAKAVCVRITVNVYAS